MKESELKKLYYEHFQDKIKSTGKYKRKFSKAVDYVNEQGKRFSKEDMDVIDNIIENFIEAEDQMLEDTFVLAVKYAYKIFNEIKG